MKKPKVDVALLNRDTRYLNVDEPELDEPTPVETSEPVVAKPTTEKSEPNKAGRKPDDPTRGIKKNYTKTINIAVEFDVLEKLEIAKAKYSNNLTKYINTLIEKDLEANFETYQKIYDMLHS